MTTSVAAEPAASDRIRWIRIVLLAIALEAALFVTLVPLISRLSFTPLMIAIGGGCALFGYISGRIAAIGLTPSRAVLHGALVGILATIIYLAVNLLQPGGLGAAVTFYGAPLFVGLNALRIVGCMAGAFQKSRS